MLFDWLVVRQVVEINPAAAVRGPKHVVKRGKTPVLDAEEARRLLDSIDMSTAGRPARPGADCPVDLHLRPRLGGDRHERRRTTTPQGSRWWVRLHEKGGKQHEMPAHHLLETYMDEYLDRRRHRRATRPLPYSAPRPAGPASSPTGA